MRETGEVVSRSEAELLALCTELREGLTLGDKAGQAVAFALALFGSQVVDHGGRGLDTGEGGEVRKEPAGLDAGLPWMPDAAVRSSRADSDRG